MITWVNSHSTRKPIKKKEIPRRKIEGWGTRHPQRGCTLKTKGKRESTRAAGTLEKRSSNRGFPRDVLQHLSWTITLALRPSERKKEEFFQRVSRQAELA